MTSVRFLVGTAALIATLLGATACNTSITFSQDVEAVGELVDTDFVLADFDTISVENSFEAFITVGDAFSVAVVSNESLVDELDIRVRDGELKIGLKNGISVRNGTLEAVISVPVLTELDVSGASSTNVTGVVDPAPRIDVSGASDLVLEGRASSIEIDASGASQIDVRIEELADARVDLSGASSVALLDVGRVTGDMSGASDLRLPSQASVDIESSGASSISRR